MVLVFVVVVVGRGGGLSSTLGFDGSPHHCSASSYLLPCRRAVASSRWLIREAGNIFQIPPPPAAPNTPLHTHKETHGDVWTYVSIWAHGGTHEEKAFLGTL